ncbi:hypothetical protein [Cellulomonas sp. PhB143]|uniref:hypothetical protein n=1 Tax=Cellulomonas sp. PhB143 TaxID=2485186 RepID=UPI000F492153|nr:hypothetical protein [Cellulomonas sp. PhB143]ROS79034.1 hypothetical protein EDF32_0217 [Cellulomonas sp. PhB143]
MSTPSGDGAAARAASRSVIRFGLAMLVAVVTTALPLPWAVLGLAALAWAFVAGFRALGRARRARGAGTRAGTRALVPAVVVGLVLTALVTLQTLTTFAVWDVQVAYQDCTAAAVTVQAHDACASGRESGIEEQVTRLLPRPVPADG